MEDGYSFKKKKGNWGLKYFDIIATLVMALLGRPVHHDGIRRGRCHLVKLMMVVVVMLLPRRKDLRLLL